MTTLADTPLAQVDVVPAIAEQQSILASLLELYAHDFSEFNNTRIGPDGKFGYKNLSLYWTESGRHPFLVRVDKNLAGLVLLKRGSEISGNKNVWDIAEFFVLRGYRRNGIGTHIAHELWRRFPGSWEIRVMQSNVPAGQFWARAISSFIGEALHPRRVEKDGEIWNVFSFESAQESHG
jgi:predicted acetyltransferase